MKKIFMFAACLLTLAACTTKEEVVPPTSQEVRFYPVKTRATETQFVEGDKISVFAVHSSADTELKASGNYADNIHYTYKSGMFVAETAAKAIRLPGDGSGLAYYAVYPQQNTLSNKGTFAVQKDQRTRAKITASDFCTVYSPTSNETNVHLKFWHRLSRICVNIINVPVNQSVTMQVKNVQTEFAFDLNTNTYEATGSRSDIRMGDMGTGRDFEAILPPQSFNLGSDIVVTIGGTSYTVQTIRSADTFRSGMEIDFYLEYINGRVYPVRVDEVNFGGYIHPWSSEELSDVVGGDETADSLRKWMPIHYGNNPPNIEGCYFIDPFETVYCLDQGNGGYNPGDIVNSIYCLFQDQNTSAGTIDYNSVSVSGTSWSTGKDAYIRGSDNNFTAFFNTEGNTDGISTKTALVISGTKTSEGIKDLYYAFVMVEKGDDPNGILMEEGIFRVFRDEDGMSVNDTWPGVVVGEPRPASKGPNTPWGIYNRVK